MSEKLTLAQEQAMTPEQRLAANEKLMQASGRACGKCSACCLPFPMTQENDGFDKPADTWCQHCTKPGCGIYEARPDACKGFACFWLLGAGDPEDDRPDRSGWFVYAPDDTMRPGSWNPEGRWRVLQVYRWRRFRSTPTPPAYIVEVVNGMLTKPEVLVEIYRPGEVVVTILPPDCPVDPDLPRDGVAPAWILPERLVGKIVTWYPRKVVASRVQKAPETAGQGTEGQR